jgi:hypothetical protein
VAVTPKERVRAACARWGEAEVVRDCVTVLRGGPWPTDEKWLLLGGPGAPSQLKKEVHAYWAHVWAARVLLYAWREEAAPAVIIALGHPAWRVREMAAKVCALREVYAEELAPLLADPVPRVRIAAARAVGAVGEAEHAPALRALTNDSLVRDAAARALGRLAERLDRPV